MKSPARRALLPSMGLPARLGFLAWMLGIIFLDWLMYGPGLGFIGRKLGILQMLEWGREFLRQFFYRDYIF
jgi:hypothetical protein